MIFFKGKKGDISTLVLVVGVFLVCATAIFAFAFFNSSAMQKFEIVKGVSYLNFVEDQIRFYENTGQEPQKVLGLSKKGNYYLVKSEEFSGEERVFYAEYKVPAKSFRP